MKYNTRDGYKDRIIKMIFEGKTGREIANAVGCSVKYPAVIRRWMNDMDSEETDMLYLEVYGKPRKEVPEETKGESIFNTAMSRKRAEGRYIPSRY